MNSQKATREIDGWLEISLEDNLLGEQTVNGKWYKPIFGCDSLEMAIEQAKKQGYDEGKREGFEEGIKQTLGMAVKTIKKEMVF